MRDVELDIDIDVLESRCNHCQCLAATYDQIDELCINCYEEDEKRCKLPLPQIIWPVEKQKFYGRKLRILLLKFPWVSWFFTRSY